MKKTVYLLSLLTMLALVTMTSSAQVTTDVNLVATMNEQLSISANSGTLNWASSLTPGGAVNASGNSVVVTTKYLVTKLHEVKVDAYFSNAATAMTDGNGDNIPATAVSMAVGGGSLTSFTAVDAAPVIIESGIVARTSKYNNWGTGVSHTLTFNLDLSGGTLPQLPAGTYQGFLHLRAQIL